MDGAGPAALDVQGSRKQCRDVQAWGIATGGSASGIESRSRGHESSL